QGSKNGFSPLYYKCATSCFSSKRMTRAEMQSRRENKNSSLPLCGSAPLREILLDSGRSLRCDVCALGENMSFLLQTPIRYPTKHSAAAFLLFACAWLDPLTAYGWGAEGHAIVCEIAYQRLSINAKRGVRRRLGSQKLNEVG